MLFVAFVPGMRAAGNIVTVVPLLTSLAHGPLGPPTVVISFHGCAGRAPDLE